MAQVKNGRVIFNEFPIDYPVPGKTTVYDESETIDLDGVALNGGLLLKVLYLSVDPYLRLRMDEGSPTQFELGKPLISLGIAIVLRSEQADAKPGDRVYGFLPFQHYVLFPSFQDLRILKNEANLPWSTYLGAAGVIGLTAYAGWKEYAAPKKGDVVFVSTAAGAVGSIVVQIAKQNGLKVIASAGSDAKVEFVKSLGADVSFNYKVQNTDEVLAKEGPIDIYWDNVGGPTLDAALANAAPHARFIVCGMISGYNAESPRLANIMNIIPRSITIYGFTIVHLRERYAESFSREFPRQVAEGAIKYAEDLTWGLENTGHALNGVLRGTNKGKSIVVVADE